jgi:Protein of unknown function (DUF4236)
MASFPAGRGRSIFICHSPPFDTRLPINCETKVETANPTKAGVEHAMARVTQEAKLYAGACLVVRDIPGGPDFDVARGDAGNDGPGACCSFVHLEIGANLLELLERPSQLFSKRLLKSLNNQADFDSAMRRFESSRPSQSGAEMGLRFSRRVSLIPGLRLHFSRSGVSASIGHRGAWYTIGSRGRRVTVGLPGKRSARAAAA